MPRKIQSAYYDTNVYIEVLLGSGTSRDRSLEVLHLAEQRLLLCIGSTLVRKELKKGPEATTTRSLLQLYEGAIHIEIPVTREAEHIQSRYTREAPIKPADALHLALASLNRADAFLSWNRRDIVRERTLRVVEQINRQVGVPVPTILTPEDFAGRAGFSAQRRSLFLD